MAIKIHTYDKQATPSGWLVFVAERVGFEPTDTFISPVFKTGAFNHSTISPFDIDFSFGRVKTRPYLFLFSRTFLFRAGRDPPLPVSVP